MLIHLLVCAIYCLFSNLYFVQSFKNLLYSFLDHLFVVINYNSNQVLSSKLNIISTYVFAVLFYNIQFSFYYFNRPKQIACVSILCYNLSVFLSPVLPTSIGAKASVLLLGYNMHQGFDNTSLRSKKKVLQSTFYV